MLFLFPTVEVFNFIDLKTSYDVTFFREMGDVMKGACQGKKEQNYLALFVLGRTLTIH